MSAHSFTLLYGSVFFYVELLEVLLDALLVIVPLLEVLIIGFEAPI